MAAAGTRAALREAAKEDAVRRRMMMMRRGGGMRMRAREVRVTTRMRTTGASFSGRSGGREDARVRVGDVAIKVLQTVVERVVEKVAVRAVVEVTGGTVAVGAAVKVVMMVIRRSSSVRLGRKGDA
jgi:hypothetical protein